MGKDFVEMRVPTLYIIVGIPGSVKTTYCENAKNETTVHISSDAIREELFGDASIQGDPGRVFYLMRTRAIAALNSGFDVLYDATNMTRKNRAEIISAVPKFAKINCTIVWASLETCIKRDSKRDRSVGKEVIDKMIKRFQMPYYDEGIDEIVIHRTEPFVPFYSYYDSMKIPHDNPHHSLGIYEHCQAAFDYSLDHCFSAVVRCAALNHDVGKPYVKDFHDANGNQTEVAHYYGHNSVGAWISVGSCDDLEVSWLISAHMDPFINKKYYDSLPSWMKKEIDDLHEADLAAH